MWMMVLVLRKKRKLERKDTKFSFGLTEFEMLQGSPGLEFSEVWSSGEMEMNIWKLLALKCSLKEGVSKDYEFSKNG